MRGVGDKLFFINSLCSSDMLPYLTLGCGIRRVTNWVAPAFLAACLATLAVPATAGEAPGLSAQQPSGLTAPDGRSLVVFYRDPADAELIPSLLLRWETPTRKNKQGFQYGVTDPRMKMPKNHLPLDMREHPAFVAVLMPGPYTVDFRALTHRGLGTWWDGKLAQERGGATWDLAPGEVRYVLLRLDGQLVHSDVPPQHLLGTDWGRVKRYTWDAGLMQIVQSHYLGARKLDAAFNKGCPIGPGRIEWANAHFDGQFSGCDRLDGTLSFQEGQVATGQFSAAAEATISGALVNPSGNSLSGVLRMARADNQGRLPLPVLSGLGQLREAAGTGFLGNFQAGLPHGSGYCFTPQGGALCAYAKGERRFGPSTRTPGEILAEFRDAPEPIARDLLRQRWIDALMAERWEEFLARLTDLQSLGVDPGVESLFFEARAWQAINHPELARERTVAYLNLAGNTGASYTQALSLFPQVQQAAHEQRELRLGFCRSAAERDLPPCGCQEFVQELPALSTGSCQ